MPVLELMMWGLGEIEGGRFEARLFLKALGVNPEKPKGWSSDYKVLWKCHSKHSALIRTALIARELGLSCFYVYQASSRRIRIPEAVNGIIVKQMPIPWWEDAYRFIRKKLGPRKGGRKW